MIASTQIISALLLFFQKTTRLGVILFLTFMVNIVLMDFAYDIEGAKGMAVLLTMIGFFVLLSDYKILFKYFIDEPVLFAQNKHSPWMQRARKLKYFYIPFIFIGLFFFLTAMKNNTWGRINFMAPGKMFQMAIDFISKLENLFRSLKRISKGILVVVYTNSQETL